TYLKTLEQRYAIEFCSKLNKSLGDTHKLTVKVLYRIGKALKEGRVGKRWSTNSGCPSTSSTDENSDRVRLIDSDSRLSVRSIGDTLNIRKAIVHELVTEKMNTRKVCPKSVAELLTDEQKIRQVAAATRLLERFETEHDFLNNVTKNHDLSHGNDRKRSAACDEVPVEASRTQKCTVAQRQYFLEFQ
ncbi:hypothetical protein AAG570_002182, partial [Ranatra chinensis]